MGPITKVQGNGAAGPVAVDTSRTQLVPRQEREKIRRLKEANKAYGRGKKINTKNIQDKKLRRNLKSLEGKYQNANVRAKDAEILLENTSGFLEPEHELERTYKVRQQDIVDDVALETAHKKFELKLDQLGPYVLTIRGMGESFFSAVAKAMSQPWTGVTASWGANFSWAKLCETSSGFTTINILPLRRRSTSTFTTRPVWRSTA